MIDRPDFFFFSFAQQKTSNNNNKKLDEQRVDAEAEKASAPLSPLRVALDAAACAALPPARVFFPAIAFAQAVRTMTLLAQIALRHSAAASTLPKASPARAAVERAGALLGLLDDVALDAAGLAGIVFFAWFVVQWKDRVVSVARTTNVVVASMWREILVANGIRAEVGGTAMSTSVYAMVPMLAQGGLGLAALQAVGAKGGKFRAQQGVVRAGEDAAVRRYPLGVVGWLAAQVLIEQQVAVVGTVG